MVHALATGLVFKKKKQTNYRGRPQLELRDPQEDKVAKLCASKEQKLVCLTQTCALVLTAFTRPANTTHHTVGLQWRWVGWSTQLRAEKSEVLFKLMRCMQVTI